MQTAKNGPPSPKEQRYLEAGLRCITRLGIAATTMDDIAGEAGVKRITLYRQFGSRTHLIRLILCSRFEDFHERFASTVSLSSPITRLLEKYFLFSIEEMLRDPVTRDTVQGKLDFTTPGQPLHSTARSFWAPLLKAAGEGNKAAKSTDIDLAAQWILVCQFTLCRMQIEAPMDAATTRKLIRSFIAPAFSTPVEN